MNGDVLHAAWAADHRPTPRCWAPSGDGRCARCGTDTVLTPLDAIVSAKFTAWDTVDPSGRGLCQPCTWGFTAPKLRTGDRLITTTPTLTLLQPSDLFRVLAAPLPGSSSVVVISRPNRKHALPGARWGHVHLDDAPLPWTHHDAARLHHLHRLRRLGFPASAIVDMTPPAATTRRLPASQRQDAISSWRAIAPWRKGDRGSALTIALRATSRTAQHLEEL